MIINDEFNYDGLGRRLKEKVNGVLKKQWIWDGDELLEERDGSNNTTRKFFSQGAQINGANYYYTRDHLGSVIGIYDSTGNVKARYAYDAYGMRTIPLPGAPASNFAFTGHYIHPTNLLLTRHRLYDPETAHWLSRDPLGEEAGTNLYAYVENNPVNAVDPLGLESLIYSINFSAQGGLWFLPQLTKGIGFNVGIGISWDYFRHIPLPTDIGIIGTMSQTTHYTGAGIGSSISITGDPANYLSEMQTSCDGKSSLSIDIDIGEPVGLIGGLHLSENGSFAVDLGLGGQSLAGLGISKNTTAVISLETTYNRIIKK